MSIQDKIDKRNVEDVISLTAMQEGMLFHYLSSNNSKQYFEQISLSLIGSIDEDTFKEAWHYVVQCNEMLRTVFRWEKLEHPIQIVLKELSPSIKIIDLSKDDIGDKATLAKAIAAEDLEEGLDLKREPFRIKLVKLDETHSEMVISNHHILYDGWSTGIILKEFFSAYNLIHKELRPKKLIKNKYREFIRFCKDQDKSIQESYWKKHLSNFSGEVNFPVRKSEVNNITECGKVEFQFSNEVTQHIHKYCKENKITLAAFLYTVWGILLQKYNRTDDVIFGTTVSGRNPKINGIENMVGLFINTLPLRIKSDANERLVEIVKKVNSAMQEREGCDCTALSDIKAYGEINNRENLFNTIMVVENYPLDDAINHKDNVIKIQSFETFEMTNYDIALEVSTFNDIKINYSYDLKLFDEQAIKDMSEHYYNIVLSILEDHTKPLKDVEIITDKERRFILENFNNTRISYENNKTIVELFEEQVKKTPRKTAFVHNHKYITYDEINKRANQLARLLISKNVAKESIVGILFEASIDMFIAMIGVLKAGAAYMPIDPQYPSKRIDYMLEDSEVTILLRQQKLAEEINFSGIIINFDYNSLEAFESDNIVSTIDINNLAYIIYTSGSTGQPKGVAVEHKALINLCFWHIDFCEITENDSITKYAGLGFDASILEIWPYLIKGASIHIIDSSMKTDLERFNEYLISNEITVCFLPTPMCEQFINLENNSLRILLTGGDKLKVYKNKNYRIIDNYGPTENTVVTTCFEVDDYYKSIPIGKPIANVSIYILDNYDKLQPIGVIGEICISGTGLARGYINKPEMTSDKFVDNPFEQGTKMYKTGDLGRWLPDGNIEFLGRIDHQVKIRGFRIELGEIESELLSHSLINEAAVLAREDESGDKYLCAYFVGEELKATELRKYLSNKLPEYMIPSYFVPIDKMPLTPNGKIDRKALPQLLKKIENQSQYKAPRNTTEEKLVSIWEDILKVSEVGIEDNFFDIGGHSLKATVLSGRIRKELNAEITIKEIFSMPTIKDIAEYIENSEEKTYDTIEPVEKKKYYEMSSAQKRLYTLQQFDEAGIGYNMPGVLELKGRLSIESLKESFDKLIERHEVLRTSFELIEETPMQIVNEKVDFNIDFSEGEERYLEEYVGEFLRPFELCKAPLLRVALIRFSSERHILLYDMHHIISDGVSMELMVEEFTKLYEGRELTPLRIQYKDYSQWQNSYMKSEKMKVQEKYWLKQFAGDIPVLNLPTDYQRPAVQSFEGDKVEFEIEEDTFKALKTITKDTGASMYMLLLAVVDVFLSKYSGQKDIVVGSPIAGRSHPDLQNIMGMFVNTLAIRNYPEGNKLFIDFVKEVKENALKAYENQDYQYEELVDKLSLRRDMSRNPLFDVMFVMQNSELKDINLEGLTIKRYENKHKTSKFDITIEAVEIKDKLKFVFEYCTKLFSKDTAERMTSHLKNLIINLAQNSDKKIDELEIINEKERQKLLYDFNNTKVEYPYTETVHQLFEKQVEETPEAIALVYKNDYMTYKELNSKANQLARSLKYSKVGPGKIVGVMLERSFELVISIIGILKAGGAYLPIDPKYPSDRIRYMLTDSKAELLITEEDYLKHAEETKVQIIYIKSVLETVKESEENLNLNYPVDRLMYVIYTSGSTGIPKGAGVKANSFTNLINWYGREFNINEKDNVLLIAPIGFDLAQKNLYAPLLKGGSLVLPPEKLSNYIELVKIIESKKVSIVNCTPSMFQLIVEATSDYHELRYLKSVFLGGEPINIPKLLSWVNSGYYNAEIINTYGPTECTDIATYYRIPNENIKDIEVIPIGRPIDNVKLYILNETRKLLTVGQPGELYIAGVSLGLGYLNRPDMSADRFVDNPFEPGEKMYKTGDLVRWLSDGSIEFLGRIDHQVKVRGFRIELGEIESQLLSYSSIKEAVVMAKDDEDGQKYLCAYLVGEKLSISEIRTHLSKRLPDYMVPSYFVNIDKMPLTPNGKIDKKALPEPDKNIDTGVEYKAPRNSVETKLVKLWEEVLKVNKVGIDDNFFDLGGHSLKATVLIGKIHKELNVQVPLREIFNRPTIRELSQAISTNEEKVYSSIEPIEERPYYEMSSAQKRVYTLQQFDKESIRYNMPGMLEIEGNLNIEKLSKAFSNLIKRHEALRSSFDLLEEGAVQIIHKEVPFEIELREISKARIEELIKEFVKAFDLRKAPLLRVTLVKTGTESYVLMYDIHHIISDGVSMELIVEEFISLYEEKELPPLRIQYKDYAAWQNSYLQSEKLKAQEGYWIEKFQGELPILNLPTDYKRPAIQSFEGGKLEFKLDKTLTNKLRKLMKEEEATLYMTLLAAFNVFLSKYTGQEDIIVGSPVAGRPHADLQNIIGMFVNTLVMRNCPSSNKSFRGFLEEVKENTLKAFENQDYQFEELIAKLNIRRDVSRNPLFDVMFVVQNVNTPEIFTEDLKLTISDVDTNSSKFDLILTVFEMTRENKLEDELKVRLQYSSKLFEKATAERMSKHFINLIQEILKKPDQKLSRLKLVDDKEEKQIFSEFDYSKAYKKNVTISELFEAQVVKTPNNIAVVFGEKQLTYELLNNRANQCARRLVKFGIKEGDIVALAMERSLEMIVAIMGVLKAGAAYLPIDPNYPSNRIEYLLKDSETEVLLTHKHLVNRVSFDGAIIVLEEGSFNAESTENLEKIQAPTASAYVIYTSGSTGTPKGVIVRNSSVVNLVSGLKERIYSRYEQGLKVALVAPYIFDASIKQIFPALLLGHSLYIVPEEARMDGQELLNYYIKNQIDITDCTPAHLSLLAPAMAGREGEVKIHEFIVGGEALKLSIAEKLLKEGSSNKLLITNVYGPTECCDVTTTFTFDYDYIKTNNSVPIGKALLGTKVYILNSELQLQPVGVAGELYIGGEGLANGYLNNPKLTAEKFIANPFAEGEKLYKTGDFARRLSDGNIEFLGRMDNQVKVRGFRIELKEIENVLQKNPLINEAIVIAKEDLKGNKYLCAYITGDKKLTSTELRSYLLKELPEYMLPSKFVLLDKLPLTINGKVDLASLPDLDNMTIQEGSYEAPESDIEKLVADIYSELLNVEKVGMNDNFFYLGGHSLTILELTKKLQENNIALSVMDIYRNQTVKELAELIKEKYGHMEIVKPLKSVKLTKIKNSRIIDSLEESSGEFSWIELNCFYRPVSVMFESFAKGYGDIFLFYVSYYSTFLVDGWFMNENPEDGYHDNFLNFYNKQLRDKFGLSFKLVNYSNEEQFHKAIRKEIDNGLAVLVPGDLFDLYYTRLYKIEHHRHYFIIKGYDEDRKVYFMLDNMHLEDGASTVYSNFVIEYTQLFKLQDTYFKYFYPEINENQLWVVQCQEDFQYKHKINAVDVLTEHYEHFNKIENREAKVYYLEDELLKINELHKKKTLFKTAINVLNFKAVYYKLISRFLKEVVLEEEVLLGFDNLKETVISNWYELRMKIYEKLAVEDSDFSKLRLLSQKYIVDEGKLRNMYKEIIDKVNLLSQRNQEAVINAKSIFTIKNSKNADISAEEADYTIFHAYEEIHLTWLKEDDAPQLIVNNPSDDDFDIETKVFASTEMGMHFHDGIIIKLRDGSKILFGKYRNSELAVHSPEYGTNSAMYSTIYSKNQAYIKVEKREGKYKFLYKLNSDDQWNTLWVLEINAPVIYFGLFSNKWGKFEHEVKFSQINVALHKK